MERRLSKIETLTLAKNYIVNLTHIILSKRNEESALELNGVLLNGSSAELSNNSVGVVGSSLQAGILSDITCVGVNGMNVGVNGGTPNGSTAATNGSGAGLINLTSCYEDALSSAAASYDCQLLAEAAVVCPAIVGGPTNQQVQVQGLATARTTIQLQTQNQNQPMDQLLHQQQHQNHLMQHAQCNNQLMLQQQQPTAATSATTTLLLNTAYASHGGDAHDNNNNYDEPFREFI